MFFSSLIRQVKLIQHLQPQKQEACVATRGCIVNKEITCACTRYKLKLRNFILSLCVLQKTHELERGRGALVCVPYANADVRYN
jgi:hypothetical protein